MLESSNGVARFAKRIMGKREPVVLVVRRWWLDGGDICSDGEKDDACGELVDGPSGPPVPECGFSMPLAKSLTGC